MRTSTRIGVVATITLAGAIGPAATGRGQIFRTAPEGPAERVGQGVGEVVGGALDTAGRAVDTAGRAVDRSLRTAFGRTQAAVESMEVTSRVYSRLHWDKELIGSRLYLEAQPGGVVLLRGTVPSREAADRAVALAASTVGVSRVVSELASPEPATVVDPASAAIPEVRSPQPEPALDPLLPRTRPAPASGSEPELEPLPPARPPAPAPQPSPRPAPQPEPRLEPLPSIKPPLPDTQS